MPPQMSLATLERQHQSLERQIHEELAYPGANQLRVSELKRRKLLLKDEIERIRHGVLATIH